MSEDGREDLVADFLLRREHESGLDIEAFLSTVDAARREGCRADIEAALKVEEVLGGLRSGLGIGGGAPARPEGPPSIPGFRIDSLVGEGGLGAVYAAWDETLQRRVALKVLKRGTEESVRARILHEARKAAQLQDPAIVTIHSVAEGDGAPAIVMEHVEGSTIDRVAPGLPPRQLARLLGEAARALAVAHSRGIVHRDLKPANLLVTPDLRPKILDFGLAISPLEGEGRGGVFEGTPLFASPEQARGEKVGTASDVFSFGSMMFALLAGQPPFGASSQGEVLERIAAAEPPFVRDLAPRVPEDLQAICLACLAGDPARRPTAADVAADLGRFIAGEPPRLRPALYGDTLRRRIAEHQEDVRRWEGQGMISGGEGDRLHRVYRRILADEDHWILDARRLSVPQTVLYTGAWMVVVSAFLLVWLGRQDLSPLARWLIPAAATLLLALLGVRAQLRREPLASGAFLAGAVLSVVPAGLSLLAELGFLANRPEGIEQILGPPFSNFQALAACLFGLGLSMAAWWRVRLTGFAWTSALLVVLSYVAWLLIWNWLARDPEIKALWLLPLVATEAAALACEKGRRFRWALPFHLTALAALVASLDAMAAAGPTIKMIGIDLGEKRTENLSFALNGVLFIALMLLTERAKSLDLRFGSRVLEILALVHLLAPLYASAQESRDGLDAAIYLASVLAVLLVAPWRGRQRFLLGGLAGIALGGHLLLDIELVPRTPFILGLGLAGLLASIAAFLHLARRGRAGAE